MFRLFYVWTGGDEFTWSICTATAKGNKEPGYSAEIWLRQFLDDCYPLYVVNR